MPARVFIDSNVIIYATADLANSKVARASLWIRETTDRESACLNLQVLNEVTNVMLKKRRDLVVAKAEVLSSCLSAGVMLHSS